MSRAILLAFAVASFGFASVPLQSFSISSVVGIPSLTSVVNAAAVDASGNVYLTGTTFGVQNGAAVTNGFPATPGAFQTVWGSNHCNMPTPGLVRGFWCKDAFVAKFSPIGKLLYATYLGGSGEEEGMAIAVDKSGNAWVAGYTNSSDFPVTGNALQKKNAGGDLFIAPLVAPPFTGDAFVTCINATGSALIYSSFLGGSQADGATSLALDSQGIVYLSGQTRSTDLPVTTPALANPPGSGFVAKLDPRLPAMVYSTYFQAPITALAVDSAGAAYVAGTVDTFAKFVATPGAFQTVFTGTDDAYVAKLSPADGSPVYATLLGGSVGEMAYSLAVDSAGAAWLVGRTYSPDFPVTRPPAAQRSGQGFLAHFSPDGSSLLLSFVLGSVGNGPLLLDPSGNLWVDGGAPLTADALEKASCGGNSTVGNITKWSPQGALLYSSVLREGQPGAIDSAGHVYLLQTTMVVRFDPSADQRQGSLACVTNGASFNIYPVLPGGVSPGEIVSLFGDRLGPDAAAYYQLDASGKVSTNIANTRVLFDGIPAPMLYADPNQVNVIVPWSLTPQKSVAVTVEYNGVSSVPVYVWNGTNDPGIFMIRPSHPPSQGAILNQDGSVNSPANPAARGSIISIFCTGTGVLTPVPQDGQIVQDNSHVLQQPVAILFQGANGPTAAPEMYAGAAPDIVAGVTQINVRIPDTFPDSVTLPGPVPIYMQVFGGPVTPVLATVAVN